MFANFWPVLEYEYELIYFPFLSTRICQRADVILLLWCLRHHFLFAECRPVFFFLFPSSFLIRLYRCNYRALFPSFRPRHYSPPPGRTLFLLSLIATRSCSCVRSECPFFSKSPAKNRVDRYLAGVFFFFLFFFPFLTGSINSTGFPLFVLFPPLPICCRQP